MHYLVVVTAFLAGISAATPTPAGGNSLADLIGGTASLAETDCTGLDEGTIAASGFICEEGTRGAEAAATSDAQSNAGKGADAGAAGNNNEEEQEADNAAEVQGGGNDDVQQDQAGDSQGAENAQNTDDAQNEGNAQGGDAADAADAEAESSNNNGGSENSQQDEEDSQGNAQNAENAQQDEAGGATGAEDGATSGGAGVNLFDLALQGFQPVDCTGIDEAVVAASGFNCIDGTRGA